MAEVNRKLPFHIELSQRTANMASYLILAVMMVCVSISAVQLLQWVMPRWMRIDIASGTGMVLPSQWGFLPYLIFFISLEAIFSRAIARELEGRERWLYHLAEWITIAFLVKLALYVMHGFELLTLDLPRWEKNFLYFLEGEFFFAVLITAILWGICRVSSNNIDALNVEPEDQTWDLGKLQNSRTAIRGSLVNRLLWTGSVMVIMAAGARLSIAGVGDGVGLNEPVVNVMVYFFLALVLFSTTQHAVLHGRWFWHGTPIHPQLTRRWIRFSLLFFAVLAIISILLPTNYSMGLLETAGYVLNMIFYLGSVLIQLLLLPIFWLLSMAGCMRQPMPDPTPTPFVNPPPPTPAPTGAPAMPWLQLLQSILFWVLFLGILIYAILQFIRQNPQMFAMVERVRLFHWLGNFWNWIRSIFSSAGKGVSNSFRSLQDRLFRPRGFLKNRPFQRWLNFRQMNPRQQVIFYYLRLIERGGEQGISRRIDQTPNQYSESLRSSLPEVEQDIQGITEEFLEARYSLHPIGQEHTSLAQRFWRNITRSLKKLRKPQ